MKKTQIYTQTNLATPAVQDFSGYLESNIISDEGVQLFQKAIYDYFALYRREFSWRNTTNPYHIVVSEIMLQQTQTHRVKDKFEQFINKFRTIETLANASLGEVLSVWQGLGYNRRAQSLHILAQRVITEFNGIIPQTPTLLQTFKGIGSATASSICAFAFNSSTVFIETNIRAVFIHAFFRNHNQVQDNELMTLVAQTLDHKNPRIWYYALMDYGVMLKKQFSNPSKKSAHHIVQSKFEGSDRQVRGQILKQLLKHTSLSLPEMVILINKDPKKIAKIAQDLVNEKLIAFVNYSYSLPT